MPKTKGKDLYPETLTLQVSNTASTTAWATAIGEFPIINVGLGGGTGSSARVVEILKVIVTAVGFGGSSGNTAIVLSGFNLTGKTTTDKQLSAAMTDERTITYGVLQPTWPQQEIDLTDDKGHGVLYPATSVFMNIIAQAAVVSTVTCELLYRFRTVGLNEYLGIVNQYQLQTT